MNLKGLIELLEKLAAGWIMKDDRGKFYRRVHDVRILFCLGCFTASATFQFLAPKQSPIIP